MNIAVLGTGSVGLTIAAKLAELGHRVKIGTRNPADTLARTEPDRVGNPPIKDWLPQHPNVTLDTFAEAAAHGEALFNCTFGRASVDALTAAGVKNLNGKILLNTSNALDFSNGRLSLWVVNTDSIGEQIQRAFPDIRVVKTLNTMTATLMVNPAMLSEQTAVFVGGDDLAAREQVAAWLKEWFGWQSVIDLGDITSSRGVEMAMLLWMSIAQSQNNYAFNYKIVR